MQDICGKTLPLWEAQSCRPRSWTLQHWRKWANALMGVNSLFSAPGCGWDVTDRATLTSRWLRGFMSPELWAKLTLSPLSCFSSELCYHSNEKKTKLCWFWGSNSGPLYWLGYSPIRKKICQRHQELAPAEDFSPSTLHHPHPTSCPPHPCCFAETFPERKKPRRN